MPGVPDHCRECGERFMENASFVRYLPDESQNLTDDDVLERLPEMTVLYCTNCETTNGVVVPNEHAPPDRGGETPPSSDRFRVGDDRSLR